MTRSILIALTFLAMGVAAVPRQSPAHVLPILFLPADEPFSADRLDLQVLALRDAQAWYAERVGGATFYAEPLLVQRSSHTFRELAGNDFQNWWPLPAEEFARWGIAWNDSSPVKLLILAQGAGAWAGADSENGGILAEIEAGVSRAGHLGGLAVIGDSSIGGILAGICPRDGSPSWRRPTDTSLSAWWCSWNTYRGTVAHELGHTFGLPHPDAFRPGFRCDSVILTNMQCHWAWPADSLLLFESVHLRSLPVFGPGAENAWSAATPDSIVQAREVRYEVNRELLWLHGRGGGTGYRWGVIAERNARIRYQPPAGANAFVLDVGRMNAGLSGDVNIRLSTGRTTISILVGADSTPRTLRIPVDGPVVLERIDGMPGVIGIGHPRWDFREP